MILEINHRGKKKTIKNTKTWRLKNMLLNSPKTTEDIKEDIKNTWK